MSESVEAKKPKIINGFCYLKSDDVIFVDLITEKSSTYSKTQFKEFFKKNDINEYCIVLANRTDHSVTPLYKYKLTTSKSKNLVKAENRTTDELIDTCYTICIELMKLKNKVQN